MARPVSQLAVFPGTVGTACLLTVEGVLDSSTYLKLRDAIIKAALDEPRVVLIDVNGLDVPAVSAWAVFTSARWHVSTWPDIPVVLICGQTRRRTAIAGTGVTRYVPVHASSRRHWRLSATTDDVHDGGFVRSSPPHLPACTWPARWSPKPSTPGPIAHSPRWRR